MSSVFVTGGTGFVGSHLIESLLARGHRVRALARSPDKARALGYTDVEWVRGDMQDAAALASGVRGVEVIYHVAGVVSALREADYLAVNRDGTARLLEAARTTGARFVQVSSLGAGGPAPRGHPLTGTEPPHPVSAYGRSKLAAEEVVRAGPLPWVIVRPPAVYGPRDRELFRFFKAATFGFTPVFGDGLQELSLVYCPDLADAIVAAADSPQALGRVLYAAHPEVVTLVDAAHAIGRACGRNVSVPRIPAPVGKAILQVTGAFARLMGRPTLLSPDKGAELFESAWTCDPAGLEQVTGWRASHGHVEGFRKTAEWYRKAGWL